MTPEERSVVKEKLREIAAILYQDTSSENLETFETIELTVRKHLLETVAPEIGNLSWCAFPSVLKRRGVAPLFTIQQVEAEQEESEK